MIAFKVVGMHSDETYWSLLHKADSSNYGIQYIPGEIVKPEFGKLFVFDNLQTALCWADSECESVWRVECDVLQPPNVICTLRSKESLIRFWKDLENNVPFSGLAYTFAPNGTKLCNQLVMIEKIK